MRKVVVNTTPVIALSHTMRLDLLHRVYGSCFLPESVWREIHAKQDSICVKEIAKNRAWFKVKGIQNELAREFFKSRLHEGEVDAMILAREINADLLVIDDASAKKYAKYLGFQVTGTLGVLLRAKDEGHIPEVGPLIGEMRRHGFYVSDKVVAYCLKAAKEE